MLPGFAYRSGTNAVPIGLAGPLASLIVGGAFWSNRVPDRWRGGPGSTAQAPDWNGTETPLNPQAARPLPVSADGASPGGPGVRLGGRRYAGLPGLRCAR